ncbi:heavy metal translocating P-type ATPase [Saccharibacillus sacchari]|uniref:heavy metal translocating P-type ATPase n=1 Tax=Saccharibacillus sacchari TaxID=456493 RepID=UPI0004B6251D|nr:cation-translocating P-type ATPase [Saccharibacillus sacchari]
MIRWIDSKRRSLTGLSGSLILAAFAFHFADLKIWQATMLLTATLIASVPIALHAVQAARMRLPSIELLVTIAIIGAIIIGEYWESAIVTFLFLLGEYLEFRTLSKTRSALKELIESAPLEADVIRDGGIFTVAAEDIRSGERVIVRSGGKVPADGTIVFGRADFAEAALTGESTPVGKTVGDQVLSGTLVDNGYAEMLAEQVGADTLFAKMIERIEEAQEAKSKTAKLLDRFARFYTPATVAFALLVYVWTRELHMAITFLVVACPGALVIGAPASSVAGIGNAAQKGVLIKGGDAMNRLAQADTFVFDKTGTLTLGKPEVTMIETLERIDQNELLRLAATVEIASEHHLGRAIVRAAEKRGIEKGSPPANVHIHKGLGIQAHIEDRQLTIGNRKLMQTELVALSESVLTYAEKREREGHTVVFAAVDGRLAGLFSIADPIRGDAPAALDELKRLGVRKFIMLTGDHRHTAERVAARLGLDEFHAELLPEDKAAFIEKLKAQGRIVAMAGDGINDAPAISAANIGLAMGGGTNTAMETADVVLLADRLESLPRAYSLARATVRNIRQNITLAIVTVAALLIGILAGTIHLAAGMFVHEASVLLVVLNAMRLARYDRKNKDKRPPAHVQWKKTEVDVVKEM